MNNIEEKIKVSHSADGDSILGTYYRINPEIKSPDFYHKQMCMETDRIIITHYRTGLHSLRIQTGRLNEEQRNLRLCRCGTNIQTIDHILFSCRYTENTRPLHNYDNLRLTYFFKNMNYLKKSDILKSIDDEETK